MNTPAWFLGFLTAWLAGFLFVVLAMLRQLERPELSDAQALARASALSFAWALVLFGVVAVAAP